ncbi:MAG: chemotaxis protein CheW [Methanomicrobiales archaeon]|nr:chemotaxis protein CheW [Methanomicrobiales archaeon]
MGATLDVVHFELGGEEYALDIQLAREIVEMMPITPIPKSPPYLAGIINLRGEITTILDLGTLLGFPKKEKLNGQKIIVLVPETAHGANVGVIVDDVKSVVQVAEGDVERMGGALSSELSSYVKGIIKMTNRENEREAHQRKSAVQENGCGLIVWLDMLKLMGNILQTSTS